MRRVQAHKIRATREEREAGPRSLLVVHAAELLTLQGPAGPRRGEAAGQLGLIEDGALYAEDERIVDVGPTADVLARHPHATVKIDATGQTVLPGFVDAHTHAVFAGSREHEVEWKAQGMGYREIAARGGGILHTVRATREAREEDLVQAATERFRSMLAFGTTTIEVKSGYGLRTEDELKILRAAARAGPAAGVDVVRTFLGAHAIPPEFEGRADAYVELVAGDMIDAVAGSRLATFCDVFVDDGFFTADQGRRILARAKSAGLRGKVHADELADTGGAALAAEIGATSADHLLHASSDGIDALARTSVVGVLLPATSLVSQLPFADGRRLIAAGVPVALGTDFNPNCWCESPQLTIALACHHNGLLPAQAVVAATINAAHAVGLGAEVGSLEPGKLADVLVLAVPSYRHLGYRVGGNAVRVVIKRGAVQLGGPFR
jgi:imidazolonepropionase